MLRKSLLTVVLILGLTAHIYANPKNVSAPPKKGSNAPKTEIPETEKLKPNEALIKVINRGVKVVSKGVNVNFGKEPNGDRINAFIYNGNVYIPINKVAEALDAPFVEWIPKQNTLYIGRYDNRYIDVFLNQLEYFNRKFIYDFDREKYGHKPIISQWVDQLDMDNQNDYYSNGIKYSFLCGIDREDYSSESDWWGFKNFIQKTKYSIETDYLLNMQYSEFKGRVVAHLDNKNFVCSNSYTGIVFRILADGKEIFKSKPFFPQTLFEDFSVDVTGVSKLTVIVEKNNNGINRQDSDELRKIINIGILSNYRLIVGLVNVGLKVDENY